MSAKFESVESRLLMTRAVGVDVSHYQGTINWSTVKAGGVTFAFMKSGGAEGSSDNYETDAYFSSNATNATAQGIKIGPYYFPDPSNAKYTAINQADNFYSIAGSRMGNGYLPPVVDVEDSGSTPTASALGATGLTNWVNAFNTELYAKSGVKPIIYCNTNFAQNYLQRSVSQWTLWIANYNYPSSYDTANPTVGTGSTYGWPSGTWKFFQYTDAAPTTGDGDVFNGDSTAFTTYFNSLKSTVKVVQGATTLTNSQTTAIDFGTVKQNATGTSVSFTVSNTGSNTLTTSGLSIPTGYTVTDPLAASIVGGASDTLTLQLNSSTIGTFAGNVSFTTNDTAATTFKFPVTGKVISNDTTPPTITAASYNYAAASTPSVSFTFSESVAASLSLSDFVVTNNTTSSVANPTSFSYDSNTNIATLSWASTLVNGNYSATIASSAAADAAGNALAYNYSFGFFALVGDLNRDRSVDIGDLGTLAQNWQATGATFAQGDITGDGTVDIADLGILAQNWQASLTNPGNDGLTATTPAAANTATSSSPVSAAATTTIKAAKVRTVASSVLR